MARSSYAMSASEQAAQLPYRAQTPGSSGASSSAVAHQSDVNGWVMVSCSNEKEQPGEPPANSRPWNNTYVGQLFSMCENFGPWPSRELDLSAESGVHDKSMLTLIEQL